MLGPDEGGEEGGDTRDHMTSSAELVIRAMHALYRRAFVKAVYAALRDGAPVHPADIEKVAHARKHAYTSNARMCRG